jgi:Spy/CpxP family protein refolding chaperone
MTKKLWKYGLILLFVINVTALLTFAYHRWFRVTDEKPAAGQALAEPFSKQLCLNGEQERCIRDIRSSFDAETEGIQTQMQEKRRAMVEEMKKASPDSAALDRLVEDISRLQAEIQKKAVLNLLKEKEVLTDEQKTTFFRMFEDHVCRRGGGADRDAASTGHAGYPRELER